MTPGENVFPYFVAPVSVFRHPMGAQARFVYLALAARMGRSEQGWLSYRTLADDTGLAPPAVLRALRELQSSGLIDLEERRSLAGGQFRYRLYAPEDRPVSARSGRSATRGRREAPIEEGGAPTSGPSTVLSTEDAQEKLGEEVPAAGTETASSEAAGLTTRGAALPAEPAGEAWLAQAVGAPVDRALPDTSSTLTPVAPPEIELLPVIREATQAPDPAPAPVAGSQAEPAGSPVTDARQEKVSCPVPELGQSSPAPLVAATGPDPAAVAPQEEVPAAGTETASSEAAGLTTTDAALPAEPAGEDWLAQAVGAPVDRALPDTSSNLTPVAPPEIELLPVIRQATEAPDPAPAPVAGSQASPEPVVVAAGPDPAAVALQEEEEVSAADTTTAAYRETFGRMPPPGLVEDWSGLPLEYVLAQIAYAGRIASRSPVRSVPALVRAALEHDYAEFEAVAEPLSPSPSAGERSPRDPNLDKIPPPALPPSAGRLDLIKGVLEQTRATGRTSRRRKDPWGLFRDPK